MRLGLLLSAFAPVVAAVAIARLTDLGWWTWVIVAACVLAVLLLVAVLAALGRRQREPLTAKQVRRADERVVGFTGSYLAPIVVAVLVAAPGPALGATGVLLTLLSLIYVRAGLFHLNPVLALRFRLYEVTATNNTVVHLLTPAGHVGQDAHLECHFLTDDVAIQLRSRRAH